MDTGYILRDRVTDAPCSHHVNETACGWKMTRPYPRWINLTLESSNKLGHHYQHFEIKPFVIIQPPPPGNLTFHNISSSSVILSWDIDTSYAMIIYPFIDKSQYSIFGFQIIIHQIDNGKESVMITENFKGISRNKLIVHNRNRLSSIRNRKVIWNLIPATSYRFSVKYSALVQSNLMMNDSIAMDRWSEFSNISITTKSDGK